MPTSEVTTTHGESAQLADFDLANQRVAVFTEDHGPDRRAKLFPKDLDMPFKIKLQVICGSFLTDIIKTA